MTSVGSRETPQSETSRQRCIDSTVVTPSVTSRVDDFLEHYQHHQQSILAFLGDPLSPAECEERGGSPGAEDEMNVSSPETQSSHEHTIFRPDAAHTRSPNAFVETGRTISCNVQMPTVSSSVECMSKPSSPTRKRLRCEGT